MALKRNRRNELPSIRSSPSPQQRPPLQRGGRMEHFVYGQFVCLRSLVSDAYLHADEDGRSVSLQANRASPNAAWRVQYVLHEYRIHVLLQGAAYGRYLAATEEPTPLGLRAGQRDFDDPEALVSISWQAVRYWGHGVRLLHVSPPALRLLCASGYKWDTGVTVDAMDTISSTMNWVVLPIPPRDAAPPLPGPRQISSYISVLLRRNVEENRRREVRCVRGGPDDGSVNENDWVTFQFPGRSVFNLRNELAPRLGEAVFTMCVRAGQYAELTPLVVDLPISNDRLDIVILMPGAPAIEELQHPDVDAV